MDYATQHHIGNYYNTRTAETAKTAPTVKRVRPLDAETKRRTTGIQRPTPVSADFHAANSIMKCTFLPKLKTAHSIQACKKTEKDFYTSLSRLADHYRIEPMQTKDFAYPYNIALAMWDMETKVKRINANWDGYKLLQDSRKTFLTTQERYDTGTTLYYIPIVPLYRMLHDKQRRETAQLLLSVCCYLYRIAAIPFYRQEESYLYWLYEMHKDWVEQDDQTENTQTYMQDFFKAELIGDSIEQKLFNPINLTFFEQRLKRFKSRDAFDKECSQTACKAFALYTEYPNANIFKNAGLPEQEPYNDDQYDNETIGMEKYISFIADTKGWLYESLSESINNEFNEYGKMEEPAISKSFNGSQLKQENLDFENRLFALLDDLAYLLYNYKPAER